MVLTQCVMCSVTRSPTINLYLDQTDSKAYKINTIQNAFQEHFYA
jgi:hypothetical protein